MALSNEEAITAALEQIGCAIGKTQRGWVHASCPMAPIKHSGGVDHNPSFGAVYNSAEAAVPEGKCHCFSCGYSGDVLDAASKLYVWGFISAEDLKTVNNLMNEVQTGSLPLSLSSKAPEDPYPDEDWLKSFPPIQPQHTAAVAYLEGRGITQDVWQHFDMRFDGERYRVCFPLRDRHQRFRGLIGRTLIPNPDGPRYFYYPYKKEAPRGFTWANEDALDLSKPVVVVEGIFDLLKVWPVYPNTTAALSIAFRTPALGWHRSVSRWVGFFDTGKGGEHAHARLAQLAVSGSRVWQIPPPPGRDDPGDAEPDEILSQLQLLKVHKPISVS